jgi:hypothetical protein
VVRQEGVRACVSCKEEGGRGGQTRRSGSWLTDVRAAAHRTCGRTEIEEEDTSGSDAEPVVLVPIVRLDACGC